MNALDYVIGIFSPEAAFKRARFRAAVNHVRAYDGAARSRRTEDWKATGTSANAEISSAGKTLRDRSREQDRNNAYARKAINVITTNTIGTGIRISLNEGEPEKNKVIEAWNGWADYTGCDFEERLNFYGLQRLIMRTIAVSGEVLILRKRSRYNSDTVPLQLQILEPDFLDSTKDGVLTDSGGKIFQGIEYNKDGKRVAYHLYSEHPGDSLKFGNITSSRVPAEDVIHVFEKDRPGQERGVPRGAAAMVLLKDFKDYQDAELLRQKIASCFALFVQDDNPENLPNGNSNKATEQLERVEPGIIEHLPPGKTITFANPPTTSGYGEHTKRLLQGVAAGWGITYESLTGDLTNVNFSSGRLGWLEFHRQITDWQQNVIIPQFCDAVFAWFCEAAIISGAFKKKIKAQWTAPRREMIDPVKEVKGIVAQIRAGLISYQEAVRENGFDPEKLLKEIASDIKKIDELGLVLESDARQDLKPKGAGSGG